MTHLLDQLSIYTIALILLAVASIYAFTWQATPAYGKVSTAPTVAMANNYVCNDAL